MIFDYLSENHELMYVEHVWMHSINVCFCSYVNGVWIDVVVCEIWMNNELDDDFEMDWCYNLMFVVELNAFLCL